MHYSAPKLKWSRGCITRMLPLREKDTILQPDACALRSTFTGVRDVHKADRVEANEYSGYTIATDNFTVRRLRFNESHDRPGCVSWHELITVNPCRVPPLLSSHTCTHRIPKNSRVSPNIHDEGNRSLITRQVLARAPVYSNQQMSPISCRDVFLILLLRLISVRISSHSLTLRYYILI